MRRHLARLLIIAASAVTIACAGDRPRPDPTELPDPVPTLLARVVAPLTNTTVLGEHAVAITVLARDTAADGRLTGAGIVARIAGIKQDSVVITFPPRADTTHIFTLMVPNRVTNTRFDVQAVAFDETGDAAVSQITRLIIVQCAPTVPGC
ncbi:MAG TPA: hypothetical protein VF035_05465 [Longimicrobiales bacterium]